MRTEVSIMNLVAYCFQKWRSIVVTMLIAAMLLGGYGAISEFKKVFSSKNTVEYVDELNAQIEAAYETQVLPIRMKIEKETAALETAEQYMNDSLCMHLDPYNMYTTYICYGIELKDEEEKFERPYAYNTNPESFMIGKLQNLYIALWDNSNLEEMPELQEFNAKDKYLRELVTLWQREGGLLEIRVYASTMEETMLLTKAASRIVEEAKDTILSMSFNHECIKLTEKTVCQVPDTLIDSQNSKKQYLAERRETVGKLEKELQDVEKPSYLHLYTKKEAVKEVVKDGVVGLVAGAFLALIVNLLICIIYSRIVVSSEVVTYLSIPFLGVVKTKRNWFVKVADRLSGERSWSSAAAAGQYITALSETYLSGKKVLITSTSMLRKKAVEVEFLEKTLTGIGYTTTTVLDGLQNADIIQKIKDNENVVLVIDSSNDSLQSVKEMKDLVATFRKEISGFIIV